MIGNIEATDNYDIIGTHARVTNTFSPKKQCSSAAQAGGDTLLLGFYSDSQTMLYLKSMSKHVATWLSFNV